jgi:hypothetical protein
MDEEKRRESHRRYNISAKGQGRNKRYEAKHPERKVRWGPVYRRDRGRTEDNA